MILEAICHMFIHSRTPTASLVYVYKQLVYKICFYFSMNNNSSQSANEKADFILVLGGLKTMIVWKNAVDYKSMHNYYRD